MNHARAAAIMLKTVRYTVNIGLIVVYTLHQRRNDIFEAFDELLLMKRGGEVIYGGKLGLHSCTMIDYLQGIDGIPRILKAIILHLGWLRLPPMLWKRDLVKTSAPFTEISISSSTC